jgi:hypothetical protein
MRKKRSITLLILFLALVSGYVGEIRADGFPDHARLRAKAKRLWTGKNNAKGAYLVLVPPDAPFRSAAERLAKHRKAEMVVFSPESPADALETLIRKNARHVAIFVEPDDMDVNLVRTFIVLSTLLDADPFCDFAFGFVTGSTPKKVDAFVKRMIEADRKGVEPYAVQWCTSNISRKYEGYSFIKGMPGDSYFVALGDQEYARRSLPGIGRGGFVHIGGCGDPEGIWLFDDHRNLESSKHWPFESEKVGFDPRGEMPRIGADEFRTVKFHNSVVWTHVCHIGSVRRMWVEGDIISTFGRCEKVEEYRIPEGRSVALAILDAGVSAFIAPLGPNFGAQSNIEQAAACELRLPLGDVMRRAYHDVVLDTDGHPEEIGLYEAGKPARWDPDGFTNNNSPHNRCLYGDPLFQPCKGFTGPATVEIEQARKKGSIALTFRVMASGYLGRTWYGNRGRGNPGRARIYETIPLEESVRTVTIGEVKTNDASGAPFGIVKKTALLEKIDGQTILHLQLVTDDDKALKREGDTVEVFVSY